MPARTVSSDSKVGNTLIQLNSVSKTFESRTGESIPALKDVSLSINEGEFVAIVGASGCGKSTLLRLIAGLLSATEGSVKIGDHEVMAPRDDVGIVFQTPVLLPWRTVRDNITFASELGRRKQIKMADVDALLDFIGLRQFANKYPSELSGGMQQRVGIARALAHDPPVLLMDEPFAALDAMTRDQMGLELQRLWMKDKKTVLFITHSIPEAVFLADRVIVMAARPGSVHSVIEIDVARPRSLEMVNSELLAKEIAELRDFFTRKETE